MYSLNIHIRFPRYSHEISIATIYLLCGWETPSSSLAHWLFCKLECYCSHSFLILMCYLGYYNLNHKIPMLLLNEDKLIIIETLVMANGDYLFLCWVNYLLAIYHSNSKGTHQFIQFMSFSSSAHAENSVACLLASSNILGNDYPDIQVSNLNVAFSTNP